MGFSRVLSGGYNFLLDIYVNRFIIFQLTKRDFQNRYLGSYLGLPWAFLKPLAVVSVMWFAFTYGLKVGGVDKTAVPFAMWLVIGIIPWFYVSDNILNSVSCLQEYSFLIKNINFRPIVIPLIKILTNSLIHVFFILIICCVCLAYGYRPSIYWIQVFYYMGCSLVLTLGVAWCVSAIQPFVKDTSHLLEVLIQLVFWGTPIIWSYKMLPPHLASFMRLNPALYLVQGYRNTFIYKVWFFEDIWGSMLFWGEALVFFAVGAFIFKRLKPHFADVL